ncbi:rhomboid family intramembrane serine protease [Metabacillus herbersteinensis]|uniref:Rhomboid family intramembrane serine protease n=1 Tax=Metabacillus herbersteinensis TaxID=283816 RepID=A0ABV6GL65_9BACI
MFTRSESLRTFIQLYPVVSFIVAIQVVFWLLFSIPLSPLVLLFNLMDGYNAAIADGEYWRLLTPIILHAGLGHVFFNTISLILFAPALEKILKKSKFIIVYLGTGIFANIATYLFEPLQYSHVGASGAIFGLFGVYLYMVLFRKEYIDQANSQVVISILVIGVIMTFLNSNINIIAHLFGLIGGFLIAPLVLGKKERFMHQTFYNTQSRTRAVKQWKPKHLLWVILGFLIIVGALSQLAR